MTTELDHTETHTTTVTRPQTDPAGLHSGGHGMMSRCTQWLADPGRLLAIIGWVAMLVFTFHACTHMVAAGDTWVAMACGRHFINHGVDTVEPFSFNSHHAGPTQEEVATWPSWAQAIVEKVGLETVRKWHPTGWINQNWLTHVIFYWLTTTLGSEEEPFFNALVYWKFGLYFLTMLCVYAVARILGASPILGALFTAASMFIARSFLDIRPAGFSNLLVAVFILILVLSVYRNIRYIWLLLPISVFWCNIHGGYIYVPIMLVPFVGLHVLAMLPKRWTACLYGILGWAFFCVITRHFVTKNYLELTSPLSGTILFLIGLLMLVGLGLTVVPRIKDKTVFWYFAVSSLVVLFILFTKLFFEIPVSIVGRQLDILRGQLASQRMSFLGLVVLFWVFGLILTFLKHRLVVIQPRQLVHIVSAGIATFIVIILFNPFHLTNLTHTFVISVSKHAERWRDVYEWHPAFDWSNPVGTAVPFLIMYIVAWFILILWGLTHILTSGSPKVSGSKALRRQGENIFHLPKIDLPLFMIGALTIYMAIRSRRFIPIAAFTACPFLAVFMQQVIGAICASVHKGRDGRVVAAGGSPVFQKYLALLIAVPLVVFGIWVGLRYKFVYLNPWPNDPVFTSVFMRMTASFQKPFYAGRFIKLNKLKGHMLNYWTEGGFIAYAQEPDPNTGKIPLQLYMDGRAQAAYNRKTFDRWSFVWGGGNIGGNAKMSRQKLTRQDIIKMGQEINDILKQDDVWVVLVPSLQFRSNLMEGLVTHPHWIPAFINNKQKLLVDYTTEQGRRLIQGITNGGTMYPDEFTRLLNRGFFLLNYDARPDVRQEALTYLIKAIQLNPSPVPMFQVVAIAARYSELQDQITEFCQEYVQQFEKREAEMLKQDGTRWQYETARMACAYLNQVARNNNDQEMLTLYTDKYNKYEKQRDSVSDNKRW